MARTSLIPADAQWRGLLPWIGAVVLGHAFAIAGLRSLLGPPDALRPLALPMMTRTLLPEAPSEAATAPPSGAELAAPREFVQPTPEAPRPVASAPAQAVATPASAPQPPDPARSGETLTTPSAAAASPLVAAPSPPPPPDLPPPQRAPSGLETEIGIGPARAPTPSASAPGSPVNVPTPGLPVGGTQRVASLADWPSDTRIHYWVEGQYGGTVRGPAEVRWLRQGTQYEASIDISIRRTFLSGSVRLTSQGLLTPTEIRPLAYEEKRGTSAARQVRVEEQGVRLQDGRVLPRPAGVQDTASQFIALAHRFATGRDALEVGRQVQVWLARPGGVDLWTYDIVSRDMLETSQLGRIEAFHLKPRPLSNPRGNIYPDIWFSPALQHLPVRIRLSMGEDAWLDLKVERIEQR